MKRTTLLYRYQNDYNMKIRNTTTCIVKSSNPEPHIIVLPGTKGTSRHLRLHLYSHFYVHGPLLPVARGHFLQDFLNILKCSL